MFGYLIVAMVSVALGLLLGGMLGAGKVAELDAQLRVARDEIAALEHRAAEHALYLEPRLRFSA